MRLSFPAAVAASDIRGAPQGGQGASEPFVAGPTELDGQLVEPAVPVVAIVKAAASVTGRSSIRSVVTVYRVSRRSLASSTESRPVVRDWSRLARPPEGGPD